MSLHPDLEALAARYRQLFEAATAGHITPDDALATLAGLSTTDGSGATWQINATGQFTRADFAGAPAVPTEPDTYIGPETVTSNPELGAYNIDPNQAPTTPAWTQPPTSGGFGAAAEGENPFAAGFGAPTGNAPSFGAPGTGPAPRTTGFGTAPAADPFATAPATIGRGFDERPARSLAAQEARNTTPTRTRLPGLGGAGLLDLLNRNKVVLLILAIAVVFVVRWATAADPAGTKIPAGAPTPALTAPADPTATDPTTESLPTQGSSAADPATELPTGNDITRATSALTSGDRTLIAAAVRHAPAPADLAHAAAFFAGLDTAELTLATGPAAPGTAAHTAVQSWKVKSGDTALLTIPVTWVHTHGGWQLAEVPVPH